MGVMGPSKTLSSAISNRTIFRENESVVRRRSVRGLLQ
mgnify:CR=1 FL=1